MQSTSLENAAYLHDAEVQEFLLGIDKLGRRVFRLVLWCDPECGLEDWNDKKIAIEFRDPLIVLTELFGHMVNTETFNAWNQGPSSTMRERIGRLTDIGIPNPKHTIELVFHSGSIVEVACEEIEFSIQ